MLIIVLWGNRGEIGAKFRSFCKVLIFEIEVTKHQSSLRETKIAIKYKPIGMMRYFLKKKFNFN